MSHPPRTLTSLNVPEVAGDKGSDTDHTDEVADTHGRTRVLARTAPGGQGTAARPGWASHPPPLPASYAGGRGRGRTGAPWPLRAVPAPSCVPSYFRTARRTEQAAAAAPDALAGLVPASALAGSAGSAATSSPARKTRAAPSGSASRGRVSSLRGLTPTNGDTRSCQVTVLGRNTIPLPHAVRSPGLEDYKRSRCVDVVAE